MRRIVGIAAVAVMATSGADALAAPSTFGASATAADAGAPLPLTTQQAMEATVRRYFDGVDQKDPFMIASCFGEAAVIRDVCALGAAASDADPAPVSSQQLVRRCLDFLTAHPDCRVRFHYGPECGRAPPHWVVAHWYETGTWSGATSVDGSDSDGGGDGLEPNGQPLAVEGQTRFLVDPDTLKIKELVVTRTISEWEQALAWLQLRRAREGRIPDA